MDTKPKTKPKFEGVASWRSYCAFVLIGLGLLALSAVLIGWVSGIVAYLCVQAGFLKIWFGILLLQTAKTYFSVVSSWMLLLSVIGFSDNLIFDIQQPSNSDPKFIIHGLFCFAWMIAFAVQADLVRPGKQTLHVKVGIVGFVAAIGFAISTFYLFYAIWVPWNEMANRAQINRVLLPSYVILIGLAWAYRKQPQTHKRLVLMGTIYLMQPIIVRAVGGFFPAFIAVWAGLFISLFLYDLRTTRRVHSVTYLGTIWFILAWLFVSQT